MARIVRFHETGGPEVLRLDEVPEMDPGPGEVRIRVEAIGLNRAEVMLREGIYHERPVFPSRIGYEAAGVVEAVGEGVTNVNEGERIATVPSFALSQTRQGVYGESATVPAEIAAPYPAELTPAQGAALWMAYLTAYGALVHYGDLGPDDAVIITAASSSVGLAAIQIAKERGTTVIATTRTAAKKDALLGFGADHVVATDEEDLPARVMEITGDAGACVVFDPIAGPLLTTLCGAAAPYGTIYEYGALHPGETAYPAHADVGEVAYHRRLSDPRLRARRSTLRGGAGRHLRRPRRRRALTRDRPGVPAGGDCGCTPLHGIQCPMRQNRGHGLTMSAACRRIPR